MFFFDGSNSETSGSLLFITLLTSCHAMNSSNCEGVKGAFFKIVGFACKRFLLSFPLPLHALFCARPNFPAAKKVKSASNVRKALPKRLLRRLVPQPRSLNDRGGREERPWERGCRFPSGEFEAARNINLATLGDPGAASRDDGIFMGESLQQERESPGHLLLPIQFHKRLNSLLLIGQKNIFLANQRRGTAGRLSCLLTRGCFPHQSP